MNDNDPEIENSPLSGEHERDGMTVKVLIYRILGTGPWSLEVVDHTGASTVWDDLFATDQDAYREFYLTVEREGIRTFLEGASGAEH